VSLRHDLAVGVARASRLRLLALLALASAAPAALVTLPAWRFLTERLDHAPGAEVLARGLSASVLPDLAHALADSPARGAIPMGLTAAILVALLLGPAVAAAALAEAGSARRLPGRALLAGTGDLYGRMLRMSLVAVLPLGLAGAGSGLLLRLAREASERALTEARAVAADRWALAGTALLLFLAHLTVDAGRAQMAARPERRSALLAWLAGTWMVLRRPVRSLGLGLAGTVLGPGLGLAVMALRERLPAGPAWAVVAGVALVQVAAAAVGWGRAARLGGLRSLAVEDAEARRARRARRSAPPVPAEAG
jgi:hypothetical protein